jgi:hypothetical protein
MLLQAMGVTDQLDRLFENWREYYGPLAATISTGLATIVRPGLAASAITRHLPSTANGGHWGYRSG